MATPLQHCPAFAGDVFHLAEAFFLEGGVADGEDFVNQQDFRIEMRGDGKGQSSDGTSELDCRP